MEPRIQYAKTTDGVSIAYAVYGEGPVIVFASNIWGSLHIEQSGVWGRVSPIGTLVNEGWSVALYDGRGSGSSDREVTDLSLDARLRDLDAVIGKLGAERFPLVGASQGSPTAVTYAVNHPERVSHLILSNPFASGAEYYAWIPAMGMVKAMQGMAEDQWEFFTLSLANAVTRFSDSNQAATLAAAFRSGMSPGHFVAFRDEAEKIDVTDWLPLVRVPTLVTRDESFPLSAAGLVRTVAAGIPNSRFVTTSDLGTAIVQFISGRPATEPASQPAGAVHTILFTDVEGSTALTQRLGDAAAREVLREHERVTRDCLRAHGGSEVKTMGDGFMASFGSATKALECAIAIQRAFGVGAPLGAGGGVGGAAPEAAGGGIRVRIGLNAGEPIAEDDPDGRGDLHGTAVIVAARIAALAGGGEILVSNVVRELVAGKGFLFSDRGDHALKGFEDPVRVYETRWRDPA